jgi:hypothetical protein
MDLDLAIACYEPTSRPAAKDSNRLSATSTGIDVARYGLECADCSTSPTLCDLCDKALYGYYSLNARGHFLRGNKAIKALLALPAAEFPP